LIHVYIPIYMTNTAALPEDRCHLSHKRHPVTTLVHVYIAYMFGSGSEYLNLVNDAPRYLHFKHCLRTALRECHRGAACVVLG